MSRPLLIVALLAGCAPQYAMISENPDIEDASGYDGATLRIVEPSSGSFLALEEGHDFRAALYDAEGNELPYDEITWSSSVNTEWEKTGAAFEDDSLGVGYHDVSAEVTLPNGDRLVHTVGGLLVQSMYAGTYAGTFSADVTYDEYTVTCSGSAVLIVDPWGEVVGGEGDCIAALMGYEMELVYLFDLDNDEGEIEGTAAVDLFGWYELDMDAEGEVDPDSGELELGFGGDFGFIVLDAELGADRISRDAGL